MPLIIPKTLPAYDALYKENVFVMHRERALAQHIRPLEIQTPGTTGRILEIGDNINKFTTVGSA